MASAQPPKRSLLERLAAGPVICAEGYLFELERRGYLQAGAYVPEVVLDHPEVVAQLHREFLRAGSDVIEAFTYYGHRAKLRLIGKEDKLEPLQRNALEIATSVASEAQGEVPLVAGNVCNTNVYQPGDRQAEAEVLAMLEEQVRWASEAGVDFVIAETLSFHGEAELALKAIKNAGLPAVVTLAVHLEGRLRDDYTAEESCRRLEQAGADVVGLNCTRGPQTLMPLARRVREAVSCHVAALPVPYRTTPEHPTFQSLRDAECDCIPESRAFPTALDAFTCNRYEMAEFAKEAYGMEVHYLGVCCGAGPHHIRAVAEALGRETEASRYSPDMSKHYSLGTDPALKQHNREFAEKL